MKYFKATLCFCLWLPLAAGCGARASGHGPQPATPAQAADIEACLGRLWTTQPLVYHVRQEVQIEFGGQKLTLDAFMQLDVGKRTARVVGMTTMGLKLFDISVAATDSATDVATHAMAPNVRKPDELAAAVAAVVRRVFLESAPRPTDAARCTVEQIRLVHNAAGRSLEFSFNLSAKTLVKLACPAEGWYASYREYDSADAASGQVFAPRRIRYEDTRRGLHVQILIHKVTQR